MAERPAIMDPTTTWLAYVQTLETELEDLREGLRALPCRRLGLKQRQAAALTGFTSRVCGALAHLREAWRNADADNRRTVETAIRSLLEGHSLQQQRELAVLVLLQDLEGEHRVRLLHAVGLPVEVLGRGGSHG